MYEFSVYIDGDVRPLGWVRSWHVGRTHGGVRSRPLLLRPACAPTRTHGYRAYTFRQGDSRGYRWAHRLCLEVYEGPPPDQDAVTRHLDGTKLNNHPSNLRWGTDAENATDRIAHGVVPFGEANGNAKLTSADVAAIIRSSAEGTPGKVLAARYGMSTAQISRIINGHRWSSPSAKAATVGSDYPGQ